MPLPLPILLGVGLAVLAFLVDFAPATLDRLLSPLVSSGLSWGLVAVIVGHRLGRSGKAPLVGAATLVLATVCYYSLTLLAGHRFSSLGRELALWPAVSVVAGAVLGWTGSDVSRSGSPKRRSLAAGLALGLLAGHGSYVVFHALFLWTGPVDSFIVTRLLSGLIGCVLATAVMTGLWWRTGQHGTWWLFALTSTVTLMGAAAVWRIIEGFLGGLI